MQTAFQTMIILLVLILLPLAAGTALQIFLSRRKALWPGMLLPAACFIFSCLASLRFNFLLQSGTAVIIGGSPAEFYIMMFLVMNVPTVLFLGVYLLCRRRYRRREEMRRMNIQDS